jgi:hypothetical protein
VLWSTLTARDSLYACIIVGGLDREERTMTARSYLTALGIAGALATCSLAPAQARDASEMSCGALWHARNAIYARNGYCFNTDRARSVFGDGCFPPYGRLSGWEKSRVDELQMWERRKGC